MRNLLSLDGILLWSDNLIYIILSTWPFAGGNLKGNLSNPLVDRLPNVNQDNLIHSFRLSFRNYPNDLSVASNYNSTIICSIKVYFVGGSSEPKIIIFHTFGLHFSVGYCGNWGRMVYTDVSLSASLFTLSCKSLVLLSLALSLSLFYLEKKKNQQTLSWPLRDIFLSPDILFWKTSLHQGTDTWLHVKRLRFSLPFSSEISSLIYPATHFLSPPSLTI